MRRIEARRKKAGAFHVIGTLDDFSFELREDIRQGLLEFRPLLAAVGKRLLQKWVHAEQGCKQ
jgi:hypothetical protein